jgi:DNA polymerase III alpha subunit
MRITSIRSLGLRQTYSPEMASPEHNYITASSTAVHRNSHAVSYCLVALKCLWLKAHFAPEFWASVMSDCHPDKLVRYMGVARAEEWIPTDITYCGKFKGSDPKPSSVKFSVVNIEHMTVDFTVTGDVVNQGLIGIKGLGEKAARLFEGRGKYNTIDDFVTSADGRQTKTVLERFIKLGAFRHLPGHQNANAIWQWYQYKYCKSGKAMTELRKSIKQRLLDNQNWNNKTINEERNRQIAEWKRQFPKRHKIPDKFKNWVPKPDDSREKVVALFPDDFPTEQKLEFQKQFLGYWIDSPLDVYKCSGLNIAKAKEFGQDNEVKLEGIIVEANDATTKTGSKYLRILITDGIQTTLVFMWKNELAHQDREIIKPGRAVSVFVEYDPKRSTFTVARGETVSILKPR